MSTQIDQLLTQLKIARGNYAEHKGVANAALEAFKSSDDTYVYNAELAAKIGEEVANLESAIKTAALDAFALDHNKHPHDMVDIKIFTEAEVTNASLARDWAFENLPAALKLDEAKVKKYAKDFGEVPGVEIKTEPRAQIATQL